jgi:spermidine/putrescine ABC transporter ATP-binding subunit
MSQKGLYFLSLQDIVKSYGASPVLKGLSADIEKGELVTFIGPSGCGKSTLLRCIAGFTKVDSGKIVLDGEIINDKPPHKRGTGMVFQNYALFPHLSVENNVGYGLRVRRFPKKDIRKKVSELLELTQLKGLGKRSIDQLSGGQQQRVALARALSLDPKILLLDEPLSNLDANLRVTMRAEIKRIQKQLGLTVIFVTHDQEEAMSISERVLVISEGRLEQIGSPTDIYDRPATEFIAEFVGYVNFFEGQVREIDQKNELICVETDVGLIEVSRGEQDLKVGEQVKLVVRPENLMVLPFDGVSRNNLLAGEIINYLYTGSLVKYIVKVGNRRIIVDQFNPRKVGIFKIGQTIAMEVSKDLHILGKKQSGEVCPNPPVTT